MTHKDQTEEFLKGSITPGANSISSTSNKDFLPKYSEGATSSSYTNYQGPAFEDLNPKLKFKKVRDVKSPIRGTERSAGIDFFIPEYSSLTQAWIDKYSWEQPRADNKYYKVVDEETGLEDHLPYLQIPPHQSILIPSGIKVQIPSGFVLIAFNKSGICTKTGLMIGAEVIDEDYQGEIHIHLINSSDKTVYLKPGDKATQFVLLPTFYLDLEEDNNIHQEATKRGERGFGSTGQ